MWGVQAYIYVFSISPVFEGLAQRQSPLPPSMEGDPGTHRIGGWWAQNRYGCRGEEKNLNLTGTRTPTTRSSSP
jgi:hypothetical protein